MKQMKYINILLKKLKRLILKMSTSLPKQNNKIVILKSVITATTTFATISTLIISLPKGRMKMS